MKRTYLALSFVFLLVSIAAAQKPFYSKDYKVGFKSPPGSTISTKSDDLIVMSDSLKGVAKVSLTRPGTGLSDGAATIAAGTMTREACKALETEGDVKKQTYGTTAFDKTAMVEGGMENIMPQEFYRTYHNGTCYEVRMSVGMAKRPKRGVTEQTAFNQLYAVLRTMYFGK